MTINRGAAARKSTQAVDAFIGGVPDGARKGVMRGRREQITLTIAPELLAKVDEMASKMGQSRAALINRAIYELAERVA
jgi:Ribbon-helix-helix protein, copG family